MNVLLVEDNLSDVESCREYAKLIGKDMEIIVVNSVEDAAAQLSKNDIDVAIIDIRLGTRGGEGNDVVKNMRDLALRIPTVVHTGTPGLVEEDVSILKIYTKGEVEYGDILRYLYSVYETGITKILGKKGFLEKEINKFYRDVFLKQKDIWIKKVSENSDSKMIRESLLRVTLYHLEQYLEVLSNTPVYEEFYLYCADSEYHTGSLLIDNKTKKSYIIMSPECDLKIREVKGKQKRNIEYITMCEIDAIETCGFILRDNIVKDISNLQNHPLFGKLTNTKGSCHWIPPIDEFDGGLINFTKIITRKEDDIRNSFKLEQFRISLPYIKNILARFSAYYGRQGQPDLDIKPYLCRLDKLIQS